MNGLLVVASLLAGGVGPSDVRVAEFVVPDEAAAGESLVVFRRLDSSSGVEADVPYSYYLSDNGSVGSGDILIPFADGQDVHTAHLDAGGIDQANDTLILPPAIEPGGSYSIGLVLDPI